MEEKFREKLIAEKGVDPHRKSGLAALSANLLGISADTSRAGLIAPLTLFASSKFADYTNAISGGSDALLVHEQQTLHIYSPYIGRERIYVDVEISEDTGKQTIIHLDASFSQTADGALFAKATGNLRLITEIPEHIPQGPLHRQKEDKKTAQSAICTITNEDVARHLDLFDDKNPIHSQPETAQAFGFKTAVVPGMLLMTLMPDALANTYPDGTLKSLKVRFLAPAYVNERVSFSAIERSSGTGKILVRLFVGDPDDRLVAIADATLETS